MGVIRYRCGHGQCSWSRDKRSQRRRDDHSDEWYCQCDSVGDSQSGGKFCYSVTDESEFRVIRRHRNDHGDGERRKRQHNPESDRDVEFVRYRYCYGLFVRARDFDRQRYGDNNSNDWLCE